MVPHHRPPPLHTAQTALARGARLVAAASILSQVACTTYSDAPSTRIARLSLLPPHALTLEADQLLTDSTLAQASSMAAIGNQLVVLDSRRFPAVHVYDAASGAHVAAYGPRGSGVGEYQAAWAVTRAPRSAGFWVFDLMQRRTNQYTQAQSSQPVRVVAVQDSSVLTSIVPTSANEFLAPGYYHDGFLARFDSSGDILTKLGGAPPGDPSIPVDVRAHAYESATAVRPDGGAVAFAFRYAGQVDLRGADGRLLAHAQAPIVFGPDYDVARHRGVRTMAEPERIRLGYLSVAATQDHVFALFSGRTRASEHSAAESANEIHVFAWDGQLVTAFRLDEDVTKVTVDDGELYLYAVRKGYPTAILRYSLPPLPRSAPALASGISSIHSVDSAIPHEDQHQ